MSLDVTVHSVHCTRVVTLSTVPDVTAGVAPVSVSAVPTDCPRVSAHSGLDSVSAPVPAWPAQPCQAQAGVSSAL